MTKKDFDLRAHLHEISLTLLSVANAYPEEYGAYVESIAPLMPNPHHRMFATGIRKWGSDPTQVVAFVATSIGDKKAGAIWGDIVERSSRPGLVSHKGNPVVVNEWHGILQDGHDRVELATTLDSIGSSLRTTGGQSLEDLRATAVAQIKQHDTGRGAQELGGLVDDASAEAQAWMDGKADDRIFTGITSLDSLLAFPRGNLSVFGALTGGGKTVFGVQVAVNNAVQIQKENSPGNPVVLFYTAEMTGVELIHRMAGYLSGVTSNDLFRLRVKKDYANYLLALKYIRELPIIIDDTVGPTTNYLAARTAQVAAQRDIPLTVFDHTEKAFVDSRPAEDTQTVSEVISSFKNIAKANNTHWLALHQLSRQVAYRDDSYPRIPDLRGSGRIEHEAFGIILLHSPAAIAHHKGKIEKPSVKNGGYPVILDIGKQRNGPTGALNMVWRPNTLRFDDPTDAENEPWLWQGEDEPDESTTKTVSSTSKSRKGKPNSKDLSQHLSGMGKQESTLDLPF